MKPLLLSLLVLGAWASLSLQVLALDRVALVIGNNAYRHAPVLVNPASDASAVADALEKSGYTVIRVKDGGVDEMLRGLEKFCEVGRGAEGSVFFYAGHGMEVEGKNYLLPVDARLEERVHLRTQAVGLDAVLEDMSAAGMGLKVIVLDCCRDNPLPTRSWLRGRSSSGGLAAVAEKDLKEGTMLVYSGAPGRTVPDGESSHSPFTESLLAQIGKGNATALVVFTAVATDLGKKTNGAQEPWIRFDGSGRSLAAFSNYVLAKATDGAFVAGISSAPSVAQPMVTTVPTLTTPPPSVAPAIPANLPSSGYFNLDEIFQGSSYSNYNKYSREIILKKAQEKLKTAGLYNSSADGVMGKGTQKALLDWQRNHKMSVTGRLDAVSVTSLELGGIAEQTPIADAPQTTPQGAQQRPSGSSRISLAGWQPVRMPQTPDVSIAELKRVIPKGQVCVIDVNGRYSFADGHIPSAILFSSEAGFSRQLPADKDAPILVYSGGPSCLAYKAAAQYCWNLGYTNVRHLSAGISGWLAAGERTQK